MGIQCPACGHTITVPDYWASKPKLKVKCRCGATVAVADAIPPVTGSGLEPKPSPRPPPPVAPPPQPVPTPTEAVTPTRPRWAAAPPAPGSAVTAGGGVGMDVGATRAARPPARVDWRRCVNHPQTVSTSVCRGCQTGYCEACEKRIQNVTVCPGCADLCVTTSSFAESQSLERRRRRSMTPEIDTILRYPLNDPLGFLVLALFTGFFAFLAKIALFGAGVAVLLSKGVLYGYCFHAIGRVSDGSLLHFMPDFSGIEDLLRPLRLGSAALIISSGPLFAVTFLVAKDIVDQVVPATSPATTAHPTAPEPDHQPAASAESGRSAVDDVPSAQVEAPGAAGQRPVPLPLPDLPRFNIPISSGGLLALWMLAALWQLIYTPVALTVAAVTESMLATLNPGLGIATISRMGHIYWQALLIYSAIAVAQGAVAFVFGFIPFGGFIQAFTDAYGFLAVGCTLGLAILKRAPRLGLD